MDQPFNDEQVRSALARIVQSAGFAEAGRLSSFLTFLVERALEGEADQLKESVLGVEVFQRPASYDPRTDPIVRVEARRLRRRLEDYYAGPGKDDDVRILLPKGGYVPVFEQTVSVAPAPAAEPREMFPLPKGRRLAAAIGVLALAGIVLGYCQSSYMRRVREAPIATVAVLPFENVGGSPENAYFGEGLSEDILDRLARVPGLKVVAGSVMRQFRGQTVSMDDLAGKVGASVVVEGSVRRQGDELRVVARLASTKDGSSLWSHSYDRPMRDVFAVQAEIAQSVANALRGRLGGGRPALAPRYPTTSIEAYDDYLQGRHQASLCSLEGLRRAAGYYEATLKLDANYAPALASLSTTYSMLGYYSGLPDGSAWPKARKAAERAIALDPALADAHAALGVTLAFHDWQWRKAEESLRKAIELDDSSAVGHGFYAAAVLLPEGRMRECLAEYRKALELDPVDSFTNFSFGYALLADGRTDEAIAQYKRTLELKNIHPDMYWDYGMALGYAGHYREAAEAMHKSNELRGGAPSAPLGGLSAYFAGDEASARRSLPRIEQSVRDGREDRMNLVRTYAVLGEKEKAVELLTEAVRLRESQVFWLKVDPRLRSLRDEPRFRELVRQVGLDPVP